MPSLLALRLEFEPFGGWLLALPLAAGFLVALALSYHRTTQQVGAASRYALWLLRAVAALTVIVVLLRPSWLNMALRFERPTVIVLRDGSRSMAIADEAAGPAAAPRRVSRADAVQSALEGSRELWLKLAEKYNLLGYRFSDRLEALGPAVTALPAELERPLVARRAVENLQSPVAANGPSTRLGDGLKELFDTYIQESREGRSGPNVAGVVVLSDGVNNQSQAEPLDEARLFSRRGVPIYTQCFGSPVPTDAVRDSVARGIDARPTMFVGNQTDVGGDFLFHGLRGRQIEVQLLADGQVVGREVVPVPENRYEQRVRIAYRADQAGSHKLELAALPVEGEAVLENNRIWTFLDVFEGGLKVLLVQGSPLVEGRFIFAALRQAGEFDCESLVLVSPQEAARRAPRTAADWARYQVVIFLDVPRDFLSAEQLAGLVEAVGQRGLGFLMTGGQRAFGAGGYADTELARLLPVRLARDDGFIEKPLGLRPTPAGLRMGILQLERDSAESEKAWLSLPDLEWANAVGEPKSTAEVLATGQGDAPLLVVMPYQSGRAAALTLGTTWRWQLAGQDDPPGKYFKRFWRQLVLYLTGHEAQARGNVWVTTNYQRYSLPDLLNRRLSAQAIAGVTDRQGLAITDAACALALVGPGGRIRTLGARPRGDTYEATLEVAETGDYEVRVTAARDGKPLGEATTRFVVYEPNVELEHPEADPLALAEMAQLSGGQAYEPRQMAQMVRDLLARNVSDKVPFTQRVSLWDNPLLLAVFVAALSAEWVLRKRFGLV